MLGQNLKKFREEKGYSKRHLAKISGVARQTQNYIENKGFENVKMSTILKLAKALNVEVEDLIK